MKQGLQSGGHALAFWHVQSPGVLPSRPGVAGSVIVASIQPQPRLLMPGGIAVDQRKTVAAAHGVSSCADGGREGLRYAATATVALTRGTPSERVVWPLPVLSSARTTSPGPKRRVVPSPIPISICPES